MDNTSILRHVDHTILTPTATWSEIEMLCKEALEFQTASVIVPPCYVKRVRNAFPTINLGTPIGFPFGYDSTFAKFAEAQYAVEVGADELDMLINLTDVKNGDFEAIRAEIVAIKAIAGSKILKVIVETCYLTETEKVALCHVVTDAKADYIKTSTGLGPGGATIEDIELFKLHVGPNVKLKAAGGIRTGEDMVAFIRVGCDRIGMSSAIKVLTGDKSEGY